MIVYLVLVILLAIFADESLAGDALQNLGGSNFVLWIICDGVWLNLFFNRK